MIVFNQEELQKLLHGFAGGFQANLAYLIVFLVLIVVIILFLLFAYRMLKGREERRLSAAIDDRNRNVIDSFALDHQELELLDELSRYLNDSRKRYTLLTDPRTFAAAVQKARRDGRADEKAVGSLQKKLGIDARVYLRTLRSTADIRPGIPVVLDVENRGRVAGTVQRQGDEGIIVSARDKRVTPAEGDSIILYCHDERGVFAFRSTIRCIEADAIHICHSNALKHAQRRAYFRRKVSMPVVVKSETGESGTLSTKILDLGGGGASMINPDGKFSVGDDIELFFTRGKSDWLPVHGEVVRTSKGNRVAHIRFGHMSGPKRDQIIRMVYER